MSTHTEYQVISYDGEPAFVLVPVDDFEKIRPLIEQEGVKDNIPQSIVEAHILREVPLVKAWREYLGMTQEQVAKKTGMEQSAIARLERGGVTPRLATLKKIAMAMGISVEQIDI